MKLKKPLAALSLALACCQIANAQVVNNVLGDYRLTGGAGIPRSFTIGNAFYTASAFNIRGDLMGTTTGELLRGVAPAASAVAIYRLYHGGLLAANERGQLFSETATAIPGQELQFNVNAPNGGLLLRTNNSWRLRINPDITYPTLGAYSGVLANGFVGICPNSALWAATAPGPWSRLHLHDPNFGASMIQDGYRDWMINGITMTGHGDQMYVGHKYGSASAPTDAIFSWSDNNVAAQGPDHMRFIFTDNFTGAATGLHSSEGLEIMRLHPLGMVGIGDFFAGADEPTERLDVRTGKFRIRQLPTDPISTSLEVVVVNTTPGLTYGLIEHRPASALPDNCEWTLGSGPNHVWTAVGPTLAGCPDSDENVGIGTDGSAGSTLLDAKLVVVENSPTSGGEDIALRLVTRGDSDPGPITGTTGIKNDVECAVGGSAAGHRMVVRNGVGLMGLEAILDAPNGSGNLSMRCIAATATGLDPTTQIMYGGEFSVDGAATVNSSALKLRNVTLGGGPSVGSMHGIDSYLETQVDRPEVFGFKTISGVAGSGTYHVGVNAYVNSAPGTYASSYGLNTRVDGAATGDVVGVKSESNWGGSNTAGQFTAQGGVIGNVGGHFRAYGGGSGNIGISTWVPGTGLGGDWTAWLDGDVNVTGLGYIPGGVWQPSDAMLKQNVQPLGGASALIAQLAPSTYDYDTATYPQLGLPQGNQMGLIAQDVEAVLPNCVSEITTPTFYDTLGAIVEQGMTIKILNYERMIPLLIAGLQESNERIKVLENVVASCCAIATDVVPLMPIQGGAEGEQRGAIIPVSGSGQLRIQPNPMNDASVISYTLATAGQVRLLVSTSEGRQLVVLEDLHREAGNYTFEWNTAALANGVYNVMLLVDGAPLVQRAVKIAR